MNRAMRLRIEPNKEQRELFEKTFGCCRFLYNRMLSDRNLSDMTGERMEIRPAAYKKEYPWLREVDSLALCNVQLDLERAFRDYRKVPGRGRPGYKSKHHSRRHAQEGRIPRFIRSVHENRYPVYTDRSDGGIPVFLVHMEVSLTILSVFPLHYLYISLRCPTSTIIIMISLSFISARIR